MSAVPRHKSFLEAGMELCRRGQGRDVGIPGLTRTAPQELGACKLLRSRSGQLQQFLVNKRQTKKRKEKRREKKRRKGHFSVCYNKVLCISSEQCKSRAKHPCCCFCELGHSRGGALLGNT